jgi:hypothetical protein
MNANVKIATSGELVTRRKPRIMIAGEFSAGKSRLINGLLGRDLLPSNVTSTALPPIWLIGGGESALVVRLDGSVSDLDFDEIDVESTAYCLLSCDAEILRHVDLIDTPGSSDPNIPSVCWERIVDFADSLIWCSSAMQAWKQTEKATVSDLPEDLRAQATLLITQADRMPDQKSADKVLRRVTRDASKYLSNVMMGSMLNADDLARVADRIKAIAGDLPLRGVPSDVVESARLDGFEEIPAEAETEAETHDVSEEAEIASVPEEPAFAVFSTPLSDVGNPFEDFEDAPAPNLMVDIVLDADHVHPNALEDQAAELANGTTEEAAEISEPLSEADDADAATETGASVANTSFGLENGTVAALWDSIAVDADLSDNERFLACVSDLLVQVQGLLKAQGNETPGRVRL